MSESFTVEPTDVPYEPDGERPEPWMPAPPCKHCRKPLYEHWKHEDGRITCTRPKQIPTGDSRG